MSTRRALHRILPFAVWSLTALPTVAAAHTVGIAGFSGQQVIQPGNVPLNCSNAGMGCHFTDADTKPPLVQFEGPTQLDPGAQGTYTFIVTSQNPKGQVQAGLDVAASGGTLDILPDQQEQICSIAHQPSGFLPCPNQAGKPIVNGGEITHTGPKDNDAQGVAQWQFTWTAPATPGFYVLYGAGNSVNADTTDEGDEAAITTLLVNVGGVPTPTATPLPCGGDCDGNGMVSISELITCVNIDLGTADLSTCASCSADGQTVGITDLVAAVNHALNGC